MSYGSGRAFSALGQRLSGLGQMIQQSREAAEIRAEQKSERERLLKRQDLKDAQDVADREESRAIEYHSAGGGMGALPTMSSTVRSSIAGPPPAMRAPRLNGQAASVAMPPAPSGPSPVADRSMTVENTRDYQAMPGGGYLPTKDKANRDALAARLSEARSKAELEAEYAPPESVTWQSPTATRDGLIQTNNRGGVRAVEVDGARQYPVPRATPQGRSTDPTQAERNAERKRIEEYAATIAREGGSTDGKGPPADQIAMILRGTYPDLSGPDAIAIASKVRQSVTTERTTRVGAPVKKGGGGTETDRNDLITEFFALKPNGTPEEREAFIAERSGVSITSPTGGRGAGPGTEVQAAPTKPRAARLAELKAQGKTFEEAKAVLAREGYPVQ